MAIPTEPTPRLLHEPLALELANTVGRRRPDGVEDLLVEPQDAVTWLLEEGLPRPDDPALALTELLLLRDAVRGTAELLIAEQRPSAEFLRTLNEVAARPPTTPIIRYRQRHLDVVENPHGTPLDDALGRIARDAVHLFGGPRALRIKHCDGPGCMLLFVADNPRRRWCSPQLCGNRVRVARHYKRSRSGARQPTEAGRRSQADTTA